MLDIVCHRILTLLYKEECTKDILRLETIYVCVCVCIFAEIIQTVTHSDKHVREGSSGVFRDIDRWDDPISLLSPQPICRGAPLMFSRKLDNFGLWVPDSWQHFFNTNLKWKTQHIKPHLILNNTRDHLKNAILPWQVGRWIFKMTSFLFC